MSAAGGNSAVAVEVQRRAIAGSEAADNRSLAWAVPVQVAVFPTSTTLALPGSVSIRLGPMSQRNSTRVVGSYTGTRAQRHSPPLVPRS